MPTQSNLICVIDADCILHKNALANAVRHFSNADVVAVGGRLLGRKDDSSLLETIQFCEYMKAFHLTRRIFALLNAQSLISGVFGIFRRSALLEINGYDTDTVGEDMELVIILQGEEYRQSKRIMVYEPAAICYTTVPHSLGKLMRQQRSNGLYHQTPSHDSKPSLRIAWSRDTVLSAAYRATWTGILGFIHGNLSIVEL